VPLVVHADAQESSFTIIPECACPEHTKIVLECTVQSTPGHQRPGSTIWKGNFFRECVGTHDKNIVLLHSRLTAGPITCNNGSVIGQLLRVEPDNVTYTSQLTVIVNLETIGQSIRCEYDNGSVTSNGSIELINKTDQIQSGKSIYS
jgi:hypothetical protein